jgi:N-acylneuraminate cytidylyltransferase/CMP-N,N'-diacetyllegionaminic acid synthase
MRFKNEFWALIPARSGSQGIKNKNIRKISGVPLFGYSLKIASKCKKIKKTIFSSDSKKYLKIGKKYKCDEYFLRSKKNSSNTASEYSVFREYVNQRIKKKLSLPLYFIHFRPTVPIRKIKTINNVINHFLKNKKKCTSMRSVSMVSDPPYRTNRIINGKLCALTKKDFDLDKWFRPRQFFPTTYKCNCIIDIYKTENILKGFLFGNKVLPYLTDDFKIDIDDEQDLKIAENYIKLNGS